MRALPFVLLLAACGGTSAPVVTYTPMTAEDEVAFDNGETLAVRPALLRLTQLFNLTGHPVISLPVQTAGLPVGLQLVGHRGSTEDLLSVAMACE